MWDYVVLLLVLSPVELPVSSQQPPEAWAALKSIALSTEVVGPHENWASDFRSELRYVRHYVRLLSDAPPLADCNWLPTTEFAAECCKFNEAYQNHLTTQQTLGGPTHEAEWASALCQTRQLYRVWDATRRATSTNQAWAYRRRTLMQVRDMLGEQDYYRAKFPPSVPVWLFHEME